MKKTALIDNVRGRSFEYLIGAHVARIDYMYTRDGTMALIHTEVPFALQGQGIGQSLVEDVLEYMDSRGEQVIPTCGFVRAYIRKHPEWERIVANQFVY